MKDYTVYSTVFTLNSVGDNAFTLWVNQCVFRADTEYHSSRRLTSDILNCYAFAVKYKILVSDLLSIIRIYSNTVL